ncbi:MAG: response regulator [Proteobacteria bacterium]|nr:response regulator [Pseudomonadota bacterium]
MKKALVIDDSSTVRLIVSKMLRAFGYESVQAANGLLALEELAKNPDVTLALVDWNMPVMSGIEFVQQARKSSEPESLKIVMVTTETEMHQVSKALEAGVDEYIMKPFTKEIFEEKLAMLGITGTQTEG